MPVSDQVADDLLRGALTERPWPWLGMIGGPLIIISGTIVTLGGNPAASALNGPASIPEALWELFLGIYCTIWGFRREAPILSESAPIVSRADAVPAGSPA